MSGNISFGEFTYHSLVFEKRKGNLTATTQFQMQAMAVWQNESRHSFFSGLGYRRDHWAMNLNNFADVFVAIVVIPFGGTQRMDSIALSRTSIQTSQISLPIGYAYRLSRRQNARTSFEARLLAFPAFTIGKSANPVPAADAPSPPGTADLQRLKASYEGTVSGFSLLVAPEINVQFRPFRSDAGIYMGLQPFAFDLASPTEALVSSGLVLRGTLGVRVPLVKK